MGPAFIGALITVVLEPARFLPDGLAREAVSGGLGAEELILGLIDKG